MAIQIIKNKCIGCKLCIKACPFDAIDMLEKRAVINERCTACGQCLEVCPTTAIINTVKEEFMNNFSLYKDVWVFVEQRQGKLMDVSLELIGEGHRLSRSLGNDSKVCAVLLGHSINGLTDDLIAFGADEVIIADNELLEHYTTDGYTKVLSQLIVEKKPEIFIFGATHIGRDLAPRVAARVDTGLTADCTRLDVEMDGYISYLEKYTTAQVRDLLTKRDEKALKQTRPAFGGNLMATIVCPNTRPQMATVRPGVMDKLEKDLLRKGDVVDFKVDIEPSEIRTSILEIVKEAKGHVSLSNANIIVSGGRGLGDKNGFELIKRFAESVGGEVGASRAAVDSGWIDHLHQVGQTGTTVKPTVYFACGISGAIQHIAGMQNSDLIIAINKDPNAPIFEVADLGIVGDLHKVIPELMEQWKSI